MKRNNELEAKDLRIDDLEVDDEWQQVIVAYMETWFDVDKKFHLDINSQDGTWLNMTVFKIRSVFCVILTAMKVAKSFITSRRAAKRNL